MTGLPPTVTATLRGAREDRGWRTSELARELRCSRRYVELVESGERVPSVLTAELWFRVLGIENRDALHEIRDVVVETRDAAAG